MIDTDQELIQSVLDGSGCDDHVLEIEYEFITGDSKLIVFNCKRCPLVKYELLFSSRREVLYQKRKITKID